MATVEDIISAVFIAAIALVVGVIMLNHYGQMTMQKEVFWLQDHAADRHNTAFNTMLEITEPRSGRSYGDLLGSSVYFRQDMIYAPDGAVSISREFDKLLHTYYPEGNYAFEAFSPIDSIELVFIAGGSETLADELSYLAANLDSIIQDVSESFKVPVAAEVYVIDLQNTSACSAFSVPCRPLDHEQLYFNKSYSVFDMRKHRHNLTRPEHWRIEDAWKTDWTTAIAALALQEDYSNLTNVRIMLPITDVLPAGSQYFNPCPKDYAELTLNRYSGLLEQKNYIINPVFSTNSDPVLYCDDYVIGFMERFIDGSNGVVILNQDNFATRLPRSIESNLEQARVVLGKELGGRAYALERALPMPNGRLGIARLKVYAK